MEGQAEKDIKANEGRRRPHEAREEAHEGHNGAGSENTIIHRIKAHPLIAEITLLVLLAAFICGYLYWQDLQGKIFIEKAEISAPVIALGPSSAGTIEKFYVQEGDSVSAGQRLAMVGNETVYARTHGVVIWIKNTPGQMSGPQDTIVKMIDPSQFRVVGKIQEDKGLKDIKPGQKVVFTVDAFGSKEYEGVVDSVAMTARSSDIVFSISDKREEREFDVSVLFDSQAYSELKNGMSARMWVYK